MKISEIRGLARPELEKQLRDARNELVNLKLRKQTGQVEQPHRIKELRRSIARMETVLTELQAQPAEA
ncbi:MAG: 50S ribosomal protein L29 [Opitutales bacterium]